MRHVFEFDARDLWVRGSLDHDVIDHTRARINQMHAYDFFLDFMHVYIVHVYMCEY